MILVDSHCHIDGEAYDPDREEVLARAAEAGVRLMLTIGTGDPHAGDLDRAVAVAEAHENVYASIGVHPHDAKLYDENVERHIVDLAASSRKVIAWGEIGLDFHYDHSPRDVQESVFRRQITKARELGLPIIIHSRAADMETLSVIEEECSGSNFPGGIMHCFGGTPEMAAALVERGFLISFAGNVTFKKADELRAAARVVPVSHMLVETDCPFLTPVPLRGKRNEPSYVVHTARFLSDLAGVSEDEFAAATTSNFLRFFNLSEDLTAFSNA